MTPVVEFPRSLAEEFKNAAKSAFPTEEYAILLGTATKRGVYRPSFLYFPPDRGLFSSPDVIWPQDWWFRDARKVAKERRLSLLGEIHSHAYEEEWVPDKTGAPSAADLDRGPYLTKHTRRKNPIFGICCVYPSARGLEANFRFWSGVPQPKLEIVDDL